MCPSRQRKPKRSSCMHLGPNTVHLWSSLKRIVLDFVFERDVFPLYWFILLGEKWCLQNRCFSKMYHTWLYFSWGKFGHHFPRMKLSWTVLVFVSESRWVQGASSSATVKGSTSTNAATNMMEYAGEPREVALPSRGGAWYYYAEWRILHHKSYSRAGRKWLGFTCFIIFIS